MFKIGLENRDFCKSLHFYIVDAGKKKKKKKKKRAASAGLFSCSRPFGPRTSPFGRCPHYLFFLCCGALASALIVDAGKKKKKKKKKKKRAASAGFFSCSRPFGPRTSPFGRCPHYLFFLCCGALASALIQYI